MHFRVYVKPLKKKILREKSERNKILIEFFVLDELTSLKVEKDNNKYPSK